MLPTYKENWKKSKVNFEEQPKKYYDSLTDNSLTADQKRQIATDYKTSYETFKADEKKYTQSLDQMVANVTTQISYSVTMMKNTICDIVEDSFADIAGQTLKASQTAYNWLQTTSKRYLDQTENPYQISQFSASAEKAIADTDVVSNQLRLTSLQRHVKVLGIFCRLSIRDGKDGYLKDLPRVINYVLTECGDDPKLLKLKQLIEKYVVGKF